MPSNPPRNGAVSRCRPGVSCLTGAGSQPCATAGHRRKRWRSFPLHGPTGVSVLAPVLGVLGAIRTHTPAPHAGACHWATRTWSRHPVLTRAIRRTRAEPQPCAAAQLPGQGSNLHCWGQGPVSCLIGRPGIECGRRDSDPHGPRGPAGFEPAVYSLPPLPQSAPPGYRSPFPKVRAWCITLMLAAPGAARRS
jgi:hypothetical protein